VENVDEKNYHTFSNQYRRKTILKRNDNMKDLTINEYLKY